MAGVEGSRARPSAWLAFGAALLVGAPGGAAAAERSFSLAYSAPSSCPSRGDFLEAVRARAPEATPRDADADLAFDVRLSESGELATGTLTVRFRTGERFAREVPVAPCGDVSTSMAIMAGLLLSGALLPEPVTAAAPEATAAAAAPVAAPPSPVEPAQSTPVPAAPAPHPSTAGETPSRVRGGVFVDGRLDFAAAPFPALGVGGGLDALLERDSWFSPSLRVGAIYVPGTASAPPLGAAHLALAAVTVRACPLRLRLVSPLTLDACALFEGGLLTVSPRGTPGHAVSMPWLGLGASGKVEAALFEHLALEAELAGFGLVRHDEFVLQPGDVNVYSVPAFSGAFSLGMVARWP